MSWTAEQLEAMYAKASADLAQANLRHARALREFNSACADRIVIEERVAKLRDELVAKAPAK